jgi:hypothetical protein
LKEDKFLRTAAQRLLFWLAEFKRSVGQAFLLASVQGATVLELCIEHLFLSANHS